MCSRSLSLSLALSPSLSLSFQLRVSTVEIRWHFELPLESRNKICTNCWWGCPEGFVFTIPIFLLLCYGYIYLYVLFCLSSSPPLPAQFSQQDTKYNVYSNQIHTHTPTKKNKYVIIPCVCMCIGNNIKQVEIVTGKEVTDDGRRYVLLHGMPDGWALWKQVIPELLELDPTATLICPNQVIKKNTHTQ